MLVIMAVVVMWLVPSVNHIRNPEVRPASLVLVSAGATLAKQQMVETALAERKPGWGEGNVLDMVTLNFGLDQVVCVIFLVLGCIISITFQPGRRPLC